MTALKNAVGSSSLSPILWGAPDTLIICHIGGDFLRCVPRILFPEPQKGPFSAPPQGGVAPGPPLQGTAGQATRTPHKIGDREDDPTAFFSAVIDYL